MELTIVIKSNESYDRRVLNNILAKFSVEIHWFLQKETEMNFESVSLTFGKNSKLEVKIKE